MEPPKLVAMVKDPNSTVFQKAIACKKLAFVGGKDAIAADGGAAERIRNSPAMRASGWSPIPIPSVDDALRAALPKLNGRLKIGVITSIGVRKDAKALDALTKLIDDSDPEVAGAAAASVGMIGGMQAARALQAALGRTRPPVFPVVARACLLCAESLMASNNARALELYSQLSADTMPKPVRLAALRVLNGAARPRNTTRSGPPDRRGGGTRQSGFLGR